MPTNKWIQPNGGSNLVLDSKDEKFFISYNRSVGEGAPEMDALTDLANLLGGVLGEDKHFENRLEETALVLRNDAGFNTYSILNGDHRAAYEKLVPLGYDACLEYFKKMEPEHGNSWSTPE